MATNISTQDKIVTALAVILGIPLFLVFTGKCSYPTFVVEEEEQVIDATVQDLIETPAKPGKSIYLSTEELEFEKERVRELEDERNHLEDQLADWKRRLETDSSLVELRKELAEAPRAVLVGSDEREDALKLLFKQRDEATAALSALQSKMDTQIESARSKSERQVADAKASFEEQTSRIKRENEELKKKVVAQQASGESDEVTELRSQLAEWQGKQRQWQKERASLIFERDALLKLRGQIDQLKAKLGQATPKKLFAETAEDLTPRASLLIKKLDGLTKEDSDEAYRILKQELSAEPVMSVMFSSGDSKVKSSYTNALDKFLKSAGNDDLFIAIGYADKSGTVEGNKKLSSERATNVAKQVTSRKPNATVQAYYMGQTQRFGSKKENRVVELWKIGK